MTKFQNILLVSILAAALMSMSGCSLFKKGSDEGSPEASADAGTDAIPQESAELPTDGSIPADPTADPNALPPQTEMAAVPPAEITQPDPVVEPTKEVKASKPAPVALSGDYQEYTVQQGDTLMKIAFETYGDLYRWKDIYEANKGRLSSASAIPAGTVLKVEKPSSGVVIERNGEKYLIKSGDTLGTISNDVYGTNQKWRKIWENNKQMIRDPNRIFAGFYLYYIPEPAMAKERMPASVAPVVQALPAAPQGQ